MSKESFVNSGLREANVTVVVDNGCCKCKIGFAGHERPYAYVFPQRIKNDCIRSAQSCPCLLRCPYLDAGSLDIQTMEAGGVVLVTV